MKSYVARLFLCLFFVAPLAGQTNEKFGVTIDSAYNSMKPVFRSRLVKPGNAVTWYFRSIIETEEFSKDYRVSWDNWANLPLGSFPADEVHDALQGVEPVLSALHRGSRSIDCDWVVPDSASIEYYPELSRLRIIATTINLSSAKAQFLRGDIEEAYNSVGVNFSLASHLAKGPTATHVLTGVYIANETIELLFEFSQFAGAKNQYWEVAFFQKGFSSNVSLLEEEKRLVQQLFPSLANVGEEPFGDTEFEALEKRGEEIRSDFDADELAFPNWRHLSIEEIGAGRKKRLLESGYSPEFIDSLENAQLLLLDVTNRRSRYQLECEAWLRLPLYSSLQNLEKTHQNYYEAFVELDALLTGGALTRADCVADLPELLRRALQCEQKLAVLSNIASLRHFVAKNEGLMPKNENVSFELPLVVDPSTGKNFHIRPVTANSVRIKSQNQEERFSIDCLVLFREKKEAETGTGPINENDK